MKNYLVTGGSGFCGFEAAKYLLKKGKNVRVIDIELLPDKSFEKKIKFIRGSILDKKKIEEAVKGVDVVIHTVAKVPISKAGKKFIEVNVNGTRNVLEAALKNKVKKVVHISTSAVQLTEKNPVKENDRYNPIGPYAKSKLKGEGVCREYLKKGLDIDIIRPRTVLGPGRMGIFDIFFEWISEGKNIYIIGKGNNKIQFLHSEDFSSCCYLSSLKKGSHIFNIGSKNFSTLRKDLQFLVEYAKTGSKVISLPTKLTINSLKVLDKIKLSPLAPWHYLTFHKDFYFDNENPKKILRWRPKYGNKEALKRGYDSYLKMKKEKKIDTKGYGTSHRKKLKQGVLAIVKKFS